MKPFLKVASNITLWTFLAAVSAYHFGMQAGYRRGVHDIATLVLELRGGGDEPPSPWSKGAI